MPEGRLAGGWIVDMGTKGIINEVCGPGWVECGFVHPPQAYFRAARVEPCLPYPASRTTPVNIGQMDGEPCFSCPFPYN